MDEDEELPSAQVMGAAGAEPHGDRSSTSRAMPPRGIFGPYVPLYVADSPLLAEEGGRGVFSAVDLAKGQVVEVCPVLALHRDHVAADCAGMKYFFGGPDGQVLLCVLGFGMLYNHGKTPSAGAAVASACANLTYSIRSAPGGARDKRDGGVCVQFEALRDIGQGEELLIDYSDRWWEAKGDRPAS